MAEGERKRILLLEDELLIAMDLQFLLEEADCMVIGPAASCSQALDLLKSSEIDAAFLDFTLRDETCDAVAERLTEMGIPWALSTGFDLSVLHFRYWKAPFIAKPYLKGDVLRVLRELLDPRQA